MAKTGYERESLKPVTSAEQKSSNATAVDLRVRPAYLSAGNVFMGMQ